MGTDHQKVKDTYIKKARVHIAEIRIRAISLANMFTASKKIHI